jgi:hypothetical protein
LPQDRRACTRCGEPLSPSDTEDSQQIEIEVRAYRRLIRRRRYQRTCACPDGPRTVTAALRGAAGAERRDRLRSGRRDPLDGLRRPGRQGRRSLVALGLPGRGYRSLSPRLDPTRPGATTCPRGISRRTPRWC